MCGVVLVVAGVDVAVGWGGLGALNKTWKRKGRQHKGWQGGTL